MSKYDSNDIGKIASSQIVTEIIEILIIYFLRDIQHYSYDINILGFKNLGIILCFVRIGHCCAYASSLRDMAAPVGPPLLRPPRPPRSLVHGA